MAVPEPWMPHMKDISQNIQVEFALGLWLADTVLATDNYVSLPLVLSSSEKRNECMAQKTESKDISTRFSVYPYFGLKIIGLYF